jgi:hypothetical protein
MLEDIEVVLLENFTGRILWKIIGCGNATIFQIVVLFGGVFEI